MHGDFAHAGPPPLSLFERDFGKPGSAPGALVLSVLGSSVPKRPWLGWLWGVSGMGWVESFWFSSVNRVYVDTNCRMASILRGMLDETHRVAFLSVTSREIICDRWIIISFVTATPKS